MHYKNGREAKNGDRIVMFPNGLAKVGDVPVSGILYGATPGNEFCNGNILTPGASGVHYANLKECLHADDIFKAIIPDSTKV